MKPIKRYDFSKEKIKVLSGTNTKSILHFKRKTALFKSKYDLRRFHLYRMKYLLNLRKKRNNKKNINSVGTLSADKLSFMFFRRFRANIFKLLSYNANRQFKKSKILSKITKKSTSYETFYNELVLWKILLKQQLFPTKDLTLQFINTFGVFINGNYTNHSHVSLNVGDVIQLSYNVIMCTFLLKHSRKLKKYFGKVRFRIFKLMRNKIDPNKQATKNIPRWILKFENYMSSKVLNVESDFITFTFIILYKPTHRANKVVNWYNITPTYLIRLYNWKYII